jgi:beta-xylosidase
LKIDPFIQRGTEDEGVREDWRLFYFKSLYARALGSKNMGRDDICALTREASEVLGILLFAL